MMALRAPILVTAVGSVASFCFELLAAPTSNPLPNVPFGTLSAEVDKFAVIPNSPGTSSRPRLNLLTPGPNGRLFVNDMRGPLYSLSTNGTNVTQYINVDNFPGLPVVDDSSGEKGFTSFAFHPNFGGTGAGRGKLYVQYSTPDTGAADFGYGSDHDEVLFELTAADPTASTFSGAIREVMRIRKPRGNHNVGQLSFNTNAKVGDADYGKLYFGVGDSGGGGDPEDMAENLSSVFGKILRIDPLGNNSANGKYGIPADNPDIPAATELDEITMYGFRHPQRYSWDSGGTGQMFIGDIGQNVLEEISIGQAGGYYGWNTREGAAQYLGGQVDPAIPPPAGAIEPIAQYDHGDGAAITAGYVVRDGGPSQLFGQFLFGDLVNGRVFYFDVDNLPGSGQATVRELRLLDDGVQKSLLTMIQETFNDGSGRTDLRFGYGFDGEVYLLNKHDGTIRVLISEPSSGALAAAGWALVALARRRRSAIAHVAAIYPLSRL